MKSVKIALVSLFVLAQLFQPADAGVLHKTWIVVKTPFVMLYAGTIGFALGATGGLVAGAWEWDLDE